METAEKQVKHPDLNLLQKIILRFTGAVYVGHRTRPGWKGNLPFYAFRCPEHGIVDNYPQGYGKILRCQHCLREKKNYGKDRPDHF